MIQIRIKAEEIHNNQDGTFDVVIPSYDMTPEESKVLDSLFPDLESAVGRLLMKQALLNAVK
jgi:hypothetical protein